MRLLVLAAAAAPKHVVVIVADDLGSADVGFGRQLAEPVIQTPALDALAAGGLVLDNYYTMSQCSPTRAALMTGRFPIRYGLQNVVIPPTSDYGLALNETVLPQHLAPGNFRAHAIGKWHLGLSKWAYTPTFRGFESFVGFYSGSQDYFTHVDVGFDFRNDSQAKCGADCSRVLRGLEGQYSTNVFAEEAVRVVSAHPPDERLFMYLAFQAVHEPDQVPDSYRAPYVGKFGSGPDAEQREIYAGMLSALDEGVKNVTAALKSKGMLDDTLIIFTTDNGGPVTDSQCAQGKCNKGQGSSNWPKRGGKHAMWDGGVNGPAFVHYPPAIAPGRFAGLGHTVDFLPSILDAVGLPPAPNLDGVSLWEAWTTNGPSPRKELLLNIDSFRDGWDVPIPSSAGFVQDTGERRWKLLVGYPGPPDSWRPPPELQTQPEGVGKPYVFCDPHCLFDLKSDPREQHDVAQQFPDVARSLHQHVARYNLSAVPALYPGHPLSCVLQAGVLTPCPDEALFA